MSISGTWCDDVFLQLAANVFNKNIILIPLSSASAHHGGMYQDIRSVHGGTGSPLFMLYFEEWITAGHYQSLELDPKVRYNLVLAHFEWRSNTLSSSQNLPDSFTIPSLPASPLLMEDDQSQVPSTRPQRIESIPCIEDDEMRAEQLQSTRQRLESEGVATFSHVLSPITARGRMPPVTSSLIPSDQPYNASRRPVPVGCHKKKGTCKHVIAFGLHYSQKSWTEYETYLNTQHATHEINDE